MPPAANWASGGRASRNSGAVPPTGGYFRSPEQTRLLFHGEWLDSGDFAYLAGATST